MDPAGAVLLGLFVVSVAASIGWAHHVVLRKKWMQVFEKLHAEVRESGGLPILGTFRLSGELPKGFIVTLSERGSGGSKRTSLTVSLPGLIPHWLGLRKEGISTAISKALGEPDLLVGDPAFDDAVLVQGEPAVVAAVLTAAARTEARRVIGAGFIVRNGLIEREYAMRAPAVEELVVAARDACSLARLLTAPENPAGRLAAMAASDPVPTVRLRCLRLLNEHYVGSEEARGATEKALVDLDAGVRLWAARRLREGGLPTLHALTTEPGVADPIVAEALDVLGDRVPFDRAVTLLAGGGRQRSAEVVAAALRALDRLGQSGAEPTIIPILDHDEDGVRSAAAAALGTLGSVAAVAPLRAAVSAHPLALGFRKAALTAIAAIHTRATGAAPGQLSISGGAAGELALAEDGRGGELSLPEEEPGTGRRGKGTEPPTRA
jgi:HEAT repeat protein